MQPDARAIAPGVVRLHRPGEIRVNYIGEPAALVAAGVLLETQLPGVNGNGKTRVTLNPDGTRACRGGPAKGRQPGKKEVCPYPIRGRQMLRVTVILSEAEVDGLEAERIAALPKWPFSCSAHAEQAEVQRCQP